MHGKIKGVCCVFVFILLLSSFGCNKSSDVPKGQPAETKYSSCTIVVPDTPKAYETDAAEEIYAFFKKQFKTVKQVSNAQYQKDNYDSSLYHPASAALQNQPHPPSNPRSHYSDCIDRAH